MRFVADESFPGPSLRMLRAKGHEILAAQPGAADEEVLAFANTHQALLLTMDRDFGQLVFSRKLKALGVVLFRDTYEHPEQAAYLLEQCIEKANIRLEGMFTVIGVRYVRQRSLDREGWAG